MKFQVKYIRETETITSTKVIVIVRTYLVHKTS